MTPSKQAAPLSAKLAVLFGASTLALLGASGYLLSMVRELGQGRLTSQSYLDDPLVRASVVQTLVDQAGGDWDSHNDPDVGRVMRPRSNKMRGGVQLVSNSLGLREREFDMPKPEGVVRVVLLGDSFIFGTKLEADSRVGCFLEEYLREGSGEDAPTIEVLHYGLISWNFISESAYLRRQLSFARPDLVVHLTVPNDIDDCYSIRGFGAMSKFTAQHRDRADSLIQYRHPSVMLGLGEINYLTRGADHESLQRYQRASQALARMISAVRRQGGEYLHVFRWSGPSQTPRRLLLPDLPDDRILYLPESFSKNTDHWVEPQDSHFNRLGMEIFAKYLYGTIRTRDLLPMLTLQPRDGVAEIVESMEEGARADLAVERETKLLRQFPIDSKLSFDPLEAADGTHINGGVDREGLTSPYASLTFRCVGKKALFLSGRGLDRPELDGVSIEVSVEGRPVGSFQPQAGEPFEGTWDLPADVVDRKLINVILRSDDYVYVGDDLQHCVSFQLHEVHLE